MLITDETVQYAAALAKLCLSEEKRDKAKEDLGKIIGYMECMNELDTDHIEPMSHILPLKNVFRDDVITNDADRERILSNAPKQKDGAFMVPKTVD